MVLATTAPSTIGGMRANARMTTRCSASVAAPRIGMAQSGLMGQRMVRVYAIWQWDWSGRSLRCAAADLVVFCDQWVLVADGWGLGLPSD